MQKGFSLVEMLLVSLLSSLLLLAASQALIVLVRHQSDFSELLRLNENTALAEFVLKKEISQANKIILAGEASASYPLLTSQHIKLTETPLNVPITFNQFRSSDWLLLDSKKEGFSLFHLDEKAYDFGLAYKHYDADQKDPNSQTLVNQIELMRFRYFCEEQKKWLTLSEISDFSQVSGVQFALFLTTSQPLNKKKQPNSALWQEELAAPEDNRFRSLLSSTIRLTKELP